MSTKLTYLILAILILTGSLFAQGVDPGTENLTHSWTFNDGTANDYVGGANGTLMGGENGPAEIWEGSLFTSYPDQWMEMPADQIAINTYDEVTIATWFYSVENANTGYAMLTFFGDTLNSDLGINYYFITPARGNDSSRAAIGCGPPNTNSPWVYESYASGPEYDDGELHHYVSTLTNDSITLYIDGILADITPLDTNNSIDRISPKFAYLSKGGYGVDPTWMGEIVEFNIYNKALSPEEVLFLFNQGAIPTSVEKEMTTHPEGYRLSQNYPNPFNPSTTISFSIPTQSFVSLKVFDSIGNEVATLVNGELSAGNYTKQWNPDHIPSGVYFYRMQAEKFTTTKKLVFIR